MTVQELTIVRFAFFIQSLAHAGKYLAVDLSFDGQRVDCPAEVVGYGYLQ